MEGENVNRSVAPPVPTNPTPVGRPSDFTEEKANLICDLIESTNKGLEAISQELGIGYTTVRRWLRENEEFRNKYTDAKANQMEKLVDDIIVISDEHIDYGDMAAVGRQRNRIDARKWAAGKLNLKKFGDKVQSDINVTVNKPATDDQFNKLLDTIKETAKLRISPVEEAEDIDFEEEKEDE